MPDSKLSDQLSEHILEIRFFPNPTILDYRGAYAQSIMKLLNLTQWQINENRVDVYDSDNSFKVFVSYRNLGLVIQNSSQREYFSDQSIKFIKFVLNQKPFELPIHILRIGVRSRFANEVQLNFDTLMDKFTNKYISLTDEAKNIFKSKITDFGAPVNFESKYGRINTNSGPMEKDQLKEFFPLAKETPDIAFYTDLDYWKLFGKSLNLEEITNTIKTFSLESWDIHHQIIDTILG